MSNDFPTRHKNSINLDIWNHLIIILDKENQGWHDKIAGTYVVRCDQKSRLPFFLNFLKNKKK